MSSIIRFVAILLFVMVTDAAKYTGYLDDEVLFNPCEGEEDHFLTSIFDMSNMTYKFVSDDEVIVDGYFKSIANITPNDTLWVVVEIFKEVRGQYILPTFEIKRHDFCKSAFNPVEVWYSFTSKFDKKYQICPNVNGTVYGVSNWSNKSNDIILPDSKLSGGYRAFFRAGVNGKPDINVCVVSDFHLYLISL